LKNENKTLKSTLSTLNLQVKTLSKENSQLKEDLKIKKLQQKVPNVSEKSEDIEILKKLNDYAVLIQENSNMRQKETKLKSNSSLIISQTRNERL
jgi:hypothetical protein